MKAQRLQAHFIKKRELEQVKIQQTNGNKSIFRGKCYKQLSSSSSCSKIL